MQSAAAHDYQAFFDEEIAFRKEALYPPFGRLVRFVYAASSSERVERMAHELAERIAHELSHFSLEDAGIIGPAPAFAERVRNRYRWHLLLRATDVQPILDALGPLPGWVVDVDPVSML